MKYALFPNPLTNGGNQYRAITQISGSKDLEAVIDRMILLGSTITEADIRAVLTEAIRAVESLLIDGNRVNMGGLVQLWPGITGSFDGKNDAFDSARHRVSLHASAGRRLLKTMREKSDPARIDGMPPAPLVFDFIDDGSGTLNQQITPGDIGSIVGSKLKFNPDSPDEGLFFINTADNSETRLAQIKRNLPKELIFRIPPDLPLGQTYRIEVRARMRGSDQLRTGELEAVLTT
ncbi:DNA-binding domain-containing protein [Cerasicoccus maritimus]|uniref:HU family DNA-binding protein n=1 Tax=Cerasicoccus maritimus TaxID=490089 RepID=UPI002852DA82|nr:DNA-binding domain-containing protein [Cerasicoccus maritimus]